MLSAVRTYFRKDGRAVGGAMAFVLASRLIGLGREALIVAVVGVHDFTDAYFALSPVVLWIQNWSFGALALYLVPRFLAVPPSERAVWLRARLRAVGVAAVAGALAFVWGSSWLVGTLLDGHNALGPLGLVALAACIPITGVSGVLFAGVTASSTGILYAARGQVISNLAAVMVLGATYLGLVPLPLALPVSLLTAHAVLSFVLWLRASSVASAFGGAAASPIPRSDSELVATTVENAAFNGNIVVQQWIIGGLPPGSLTLNGYLTRLILIPVSGLLQPVQQRLLIAFSVNDGMGAARAARLVAAAALATGAALALLLGVAALATHAFWPEQLSALASDTSSGLLVGAYACYAGVMFSNQAFARLFFSRGLGWHYALVMTGAYGLGLLAKLLLVPTLGLIAVPVSSILAEGIALIAFAFVVPSLAAHTERWLATR
jgi:hypothetical protein